MNTFLSNYYSIVQPFARNLNNFFVPLIFRSFLQVKCLSLLVISYFKYFLLVKDTNQCFTSPTWRRLHRQPQRPPVNPK